MVASFGIASIDKDGGGDWNTKIGFDGYDSKGVPNQLKARVLESGSSKQPKRPFVRPAVNATKVKAQAEMARVVDEELKKIFGG
jgi:HK97 gp10 family phage protein